MKYDDYTIIARRADDALFGDTVSSDKPRADFREIYRHGGAYDIVAVIPGREPYANIARDFMGVETLEYRNSDALDFHEVSYRQIKDALRRAYLQGYIAGKTEAGAE
jgi:hypothetical protein